jgi:hypothetical protein
MSVFAEGYGFISHLFDDLGELFIITIVSKLLNEVVAEAVIHEVPTVVDGRVENVVEKLFVVGGDGVEHIGLEESTATLVFGESWRILE